MKPAPPVTRARGGISVLLVARRRLLLRASTDAEQVAQRVDDGEALAVRRSGAQPDSWFVEELIHQRAGKVFDSLPVGGGQMVEFPQCVRQLVLAHSVD